MLLDGVTYHQLIDDLQQRIEDVLDDTVLYIDIKNIAGILTIGFDNGS